MYTLLAKPTVEKDLRSIRSEDLAAVNDKIQSLVEQPRQHKTEKLKVNLISGSRGDAEKTSRH